MNETPLCLHSPPIVWNWLNLSSIQRQPIHILFSSRFRCLMRITTSFRLFRSIKIKEWQRNPCSKFCLVWFFSSLFLPGCPHYRTWVLSLSEPLHSELPFYRYIEVLHRNLVYLASIADAAENTLPVSDDNELFLCGVLLWHSLLNYE